MPDVETVPDLATEGVGERSAGVGRGGHMTVLGLAASSDPHVTMGATRGARSASKRFGAVRLLSLCAPQAARHPP